MTALTAACRARWGRVSSGPERGMSLTELLVASIVLMIVLTVAANLFINATKSMGTAAAVNANTANASNGMNEAAGVIRAGTSNPVQAQVLDNPAFVEAKPESVILYSLVGGDRTDPHPVMIHLYLNSQRQLVEDRWAATVLAGGYSGFPSPYVGAPGYVAPQSSRTLTTTVSPHAGSAAYLFSYYSDVPGTVPLATAGTDVPAASLAAIVTVRVSLTVQKSATDSNSPVTLENLVGIPNLNASATVS
jgi:type II secretory pathway pseudopilin PulG